MYIDEKFQWVQFTQSFYYISQTYDLSKFLCQNTNSTSLNIPQDCTVELYIVPYGHWPHFEKCHQLASITLILNPQ